jgi:2,3-bisphosphoglycerate-independent phosphoglycerate mutase
LEELGGKTPLEAAATPNMDRLAKVSEIGMVRTVPEGMAPGSDTANLSVIGYDPKCYYTGRSPLEALSIGVDMAPDDVSFRCNVVTLSEEEEKYEDRKILDHSSDEISTEEAAVLLEALKEGLKRDGYEFYVGTSYRHLLIWKHGSVVELTPPHDILTKRIGEFLPKDSLLREMMEKSYEILNHHPVNEARRKNGLKPANSAWFWGAGTRPALKAFEELHGKTGAMISAVDLLKGIAVGAGMQNLMVEGANGGLHTNYTGKAEAAVKALTEDGILVNQHENAYYTSFAQSMRRAHCRIVNLFPICKVYQAHIPTYPSGHWLFGFASKKYDPVVDLKADAWNQLGIYTRYYNTDLHRGCFALPTYINELLERDL